MNQLGKVLPVAVTLTRAQVPVEETWRLEDIFATTAAWEAELTQLLSDFDGLARFKGRLGEGAGVLLACLESFEDLHNGASAASSALAPSLMSPAER